MDWFPRMQAISLKEEDNENDQLEFRDLQEQIRLNHITMNELNTKIQDLHQVKLNLICINIKIWIIFY